MAGYKATKPGFREMFIPSSGDSPSVRARKITTIIAALVFIAAVSVLAVYFSRVAKNRLEIEEQRKRRAEAELSVITQATTTAPTETEGPVETEPPPLVMLPSIESFVA